MFGLVVAAEAQLDDLAFQPPDRLLDLGSPVIESDRLVYQKALDSSAGDLGGNLERPSGDDRLSDDLVATTVKAIQEHEPGTRIYVPHTVRSEPRLRIFYELYEDEAAFQVHEAQPYVRDFLAQRERLLEDVTVDWVTALPGVISATALAEFVAALEAQDEGDAA